jgi:hypothetical protein
LARLARARYNFSIHPPGHPGTASGARLSGRAPASTIAAFFAPPAPAAGFDFDFAQFEQQTLSSKRNGPPHVSSPRRARHLLMLAT